jgi:uncharacterized protein YjiS (DUF1127 family)
MTHTSLAFRRSADRRERRLAQSDPARLLGRIAHAFAAWRQTRRRFHAEAQLRRKLEGYNDHLLRDMGFEPDAPHRPLRRGTEAAWIGDWADPWAGDHHNDNWR